MAYLGSHPPEHHPWVVSEELASPLNMHYKVLNINMCYIKNPHLKLADLAEQVRETHRAYQLARDNRESPEQVNSLLQVADATSKFFLDWRLGAIFTGAALEGVTDDAHAADTKNLYDLYAAMEAALVALNESSLNETRNANFISAMGALKGAIDIYNDEHTAWSS